MTVEKIIFALIVILGAITIVSKVYAEDRIEIWQNNRYGMPTTLYPQYEGRVTRDRVELYENNKYGLSPSLYPDIEIKRQRTPSRDLNVDTRRNNSYPTSPRTLDAKPYGALDIGR